MPTENRSSNTEMVSVPREHELKIRQTPLADLLSGLKTGEIRDCSDREFAVGDTVLLREIDDARDYTGTVLRRTITHVQKHYGLPDHLCVLSYGQAAPQPHAEPIAWMVGTAFWWTKEEAERDAAETGLPIVGLGPLYSGQVQGEPVAWRYRHAKPGMSWFFTESPDASGCLVDGFEYEVSPLYVRADLGEVERLREGIAKHWKVVCDQRAEIESLRDQLAKVVRSGALTASEHEALEAECCALSASAEPSAPTPQTINGHKLNCEAVDDYKPGDCSCGAEPDSKS